MGLFRISRPLVVDARQCSEAGTIGTDLGFINVKRGDWIIRGEDGESYILDDAFFQRTFSPLQEHLPSPPQHAAPGINPAALIQENPTRSPIPSNHRLAHRPAPLPSGTVRRRSLRMH